MAAVVSTRSVLQIEAFESVSISKLVVMTAALLSLFIDQSFGATYSAIQNDAGGTLGASGDELPWMTIGYNAFYWIVIILTPWLIGRFSRRVVFGAGHLAFGLVTIYLATATWFDGFVFARCLEGLAQGTFFVCSVMTVLTLFPPKFRAVAFSVFGVTSLSGAASGSFIGGWFLDHAYWRDALLAYAIAAIVVGFVIWTLLEAPTGQGEGRFDVPGIAFAFVAFFSYQYVAAFGERRDWLSSPDIAVAILSSAVGFGLFIWRELCDDRCGFVQLRLFNIRNLSVASVLGFGLGIPLLGANLFVQYAQTLLGFPPSIAGALLALRVPAIILVAPVVVSLVVADKINLKLPIVVGFVLVPVSYAMLAVLTTSGSDFSTFVVALVLSGAGFACLFTPIANLLVRSLPEDVRAEGVAIFKFVLLLGGSIATTVLGVSYDHSLANFTSLLAGEASLRHFAQAGVTNATAGMLAVVSQQAAVLAFADSSKVVSLVSLLNLPLVAFLQKPAPASPVPQPPPPTEAADVAASQ
jgi:MFS transporter, DHA2 family, multidrug resistance protein